MMHGVGSVRKIENSQAMLDEIQTNHSEGGETNVRSKKTTCRRDRMWTGR